jgi:cysteine desulfurase
VVTEHKAILDTAKHLESEGKRVTYLGVDKYGLIDLQELEAASTDRTILVSIMFANNEIGTMAPISQIGAICRKHCVLFHTDATQGAGKIPINVDQMHIDLLSISAHKMHGPKGVGALYVRAKDPRVRLAAQIDGGGHENGMRSGTINVTGVVGFGKAAEICRLEMEQDSSHCAKLRDQLSATILDAVPCSKLNGHPTLRLPHNLSIAFEGLESEALLVELKDVALSSGSACSSSSIDSSHVLRSLPDGERIARSTLRFGLSRFSTEEEVEYVGRRVIETVAKQQGRLNSRRV